jgi:Fic family protein
MVKAVDLTATATSRKIEAIERLLETMTSEARERVPKIYTKELIEMLFRQPYCKIGFLVEAGIAERKTASRYLGELEKAGLLTSQKVGREILFVNERLIGLLSAG